MSGRVVVVGLGPAGPDLLSEAARSALAACPDSCRYLRTTRHPAASAVGHARSFDAVYDGADTLDEVYARIVDTLVEAATSAGEVVYAVPGSPLVAERTVQMLRFDDRVSVTVVPAMSFLDLAWDRLGIDPVVAGVRLVDAHRFAVEAAGERGPLLVAQCDSQLVLSEMKLAIDEPPAEPVVVLQRLGLPGESVRQVSWPDLDRDVEADHLTSVWIPGLGVPVGSELVRFAELVRTLRERCPWDREQTHLSLVPYLIEEAYEVVEAIEGGDPAHLEEELGDLLFQVFFHATLGSEEGQFTVADVARGIHDKLVRRHPHVFGDVDADTAGQVVANWQAIKQAEKGRTSLMDGVPTTLPALMAAAKVQHRARSVGFDWPDTEGPCAKVEEELAEVRAAVGRDEVQAEVGDLLFAGVNVARHYGVEPESALRGAIQRFTARFQTVEHLATQRGLDLNTLDLSALDSLWDEAKALTQAPDPRSN